MTADSLILKVAGVLSNTERTRRYAMRVDGIPQIDRLSTSERILLIEDIRDRIASDESAVPVPRSRLD